jgi:hypothetical protein
VWVITHTLTGLALGAVLAGRAAPLWVIVAAAVLMHVLLDLVPHWDYVYTRNRAIWAVADVTASVAVLVSVRLVAGAEWAVVIAGIVSAVPDLDVLNALWPTKRRIRLFPSHWSGFPHGTAPPVAGTVVQAVFAVASIAILVGASV